MNGMHSMAVAPFASDPVGWTIALGGTLITLWTIVFAVRSAIAPGETDSNHPKLLILKDDR